MPGSRQLPALALAIGLAPLPALAACDALRPIPRDEVRQLMSLMVAPEADPLEQLFAFEDLMCSDQPVIRTMALGAGSTASNPAVRSQILFRALTEQKVIRIIFGEGRAAAGTGKVQDVAPQDLPVAAISETAGCISFVAPAGGEDCQPDYHVKLMNAGLRFHTYIGQYLLSGDIAYQHGDTLTGELQFLNGIYPVTIKLF